ncbi:glycosyltransferase [Flavihumibacter sp. R14]|nr:glycosyltransferase [Flavihumibacter soli]
MSNVYLFLISLSWLSLSLFLVIKSRKVHYLKNISPVVNLPVPSVDIIVAVKDEEADVEAALTSVYMQRYPKFKIIVVNDRSTDRTAEILDRMVQNNSAITVISIENLPQGWLGKNNALFQGYLASSSEWLLFTDADVIFDLRALNRAMRYAQAKQLDHLAIIPEITSRSGLFRSVINTFAIMLEMRQRPWDVSDPTSGASIGIGAFNLVKRTAYERAGTHTAISMRPDDDLKLGERIKAAGLRQDVLYGEGGISLDWYPGLPQFVKGLMKNTFSIADYNLLKAIGMGLACLIVFVLPVPIVLFSGTKGLLSALVILVAQILLMLLKKGIHGRWWHALMIPFAGSVMIYIILLSAIKTMRQGGIYWRDSFYGLKELKKQR